MNYINLTTHEYPVTEGMFRSNFPNTSFGTISDEILNAFGFAKVGPGVMPSYDGATQRVVEAAPISAGDQWLTSYSIIQLTAQEMADIAAEALYVQNLIEAERIASLWQAAHDYEYAQVSGSAIGLLAMGVMNEKPKCIAVQNWIKGIWTEYYTRKAGTSTNTDFSIAGECPHSVPELMEELGL